MGIVQKFGHVGLIIPLYDVLSKGRGFLSENITTSLNNNIVNLEFQVLRDAFEQLGIFYQWLAEVDNRGLFLARAFSVFNDPECARRMLQNRCARIVCAEDDFLFRKLQCGARRAAPATPEGTKPVHLTGIRREYETSIENQAP